MDSEILAVLRPVYTSTLMSARIVMWTLRVSTTNLTLLYTAYSKYSEFTLVPKDFSHIPAIQFVYPLAPLIANIRVMLRWILSSFPDGASIPFWDCSLTNVRFSIRRPALSSSGDHRHHWNGWLVPSKYTRHDEKSSCWVLCSVKLLTGLSSTVGSRRICLLRSGSKMPMIQRITCLNSCEKS